MITNRKTFMASNIILIFYLLWKVPIVAFYMSTYFAMMVLVGWILLLFLSYKNQLWKIKMVDLWFSIYIFLELLIKLRYGNGFLRSLWSVFLEILPYVVARVIIEKEDKKSADIVVILLLITNLLTSLTTVIGYSTFPNASRILAADSTAYQTYFKYNIGGFGFVYSIVITHPMFVCFFKQKKNYLLLVLYSFIVGLCAFLSNYTTAALLFILSCVSFFVPFSNQVKVGKRRVRWIVIFLIVSIFVLPNILRYISSLGILSESSKKINDIANILQGLSTSEIDTYNRQLRYSMSWETFLRFPIIGGFWFEYLYLGGHSFWLDFLGQFGIVGGMIIIGIYIGLIKQYRILSNNTSSVYFSYISLLLALMLSILNPGLWIFEIAFIVPMIVYVVSLKE